MLHNRLQIRLLPSLILALRIQIRELLTECLSRLKDLLYLSRLFVRGACVYSVTHHLILSGCVAESTAAAYVAAKD
jgi:hypothetical protein